MSIQEIVQADYDDDDDNNDDDDKFTVFFAARADS